MNHRSRGFIDTILAMGVFLLTGCSGLLPQGRELAFSHYFIDTGHAESFTDVLAYFSRNPTQPFDPRRLNGYHRHTLWTRAIMDQPVVLADDPYHGQGVLYFDGVMMDEVDVWFQTTQGWEGPAYLGDRQAPPTTGTGTRAPGLLVPSSAIGPVIMRIRTSNSIQLPPKFLVLPEFMRKETVESILVGGLVLSLLALTLVALVIANAVNDRRLRFTGLMDLGLAIFVVVYFGFARAYLLPDITFQNWMDVPVYVANMAIFVGMSRAYLGTLSLRRWVRLVAWSSIVAAPLFLSLIDHQSAVIYVVLLAGLIPALSVVRAMVRAKHDNLAVQFLIIWGPMALGFILSSLASLSGSTNLLLSGWVLALGLAFSLAAINIVPFYEIYNLRKNSQTQMQIMATMQVSTEINQRGLAIVHDLRGLVQGFNLELDALKRQKAKVDCLLDFHAPPELQDAYEPLGANLERNLAGLENTGKALGQISQLLNPARQGETFLLVANIHETLAVFQTAIATTTDHVRCLDTDEDWEIKGDRLVFTHWLNNVLRNNLAAITSRSQALLVSVARDGDDLVVSIGNQGPPIPAKVIQTLWQEKTMGSFGLGLIRRASKELGCRLDLCNTPEGTFYKLRIPKTIVVAAHPINSGS